MENKVSGKLKEKMETQTFSSGFAKREFVVTTEEQYPQDIKLEFVKDKCELLEQHEIGDGVMVSFNLRGNEYNGKYYVNLQAWKIEVASLVAALPAEEIADDLPF
jgi:single-strand DNA-binding protein